MKQIDDFVRDRLEDLSDQVDIMRAMKAVEGQILSGESIELYGREYITSVEEEVAAQPAEAAFTLGNQF